MLQFKEFVPRALESGTVRVDHGFGCKGMSKSLSIQTLDNGHIRAKCFRCDKSGNYKPKALCAEHIKKQLIAMIHAEWIFRPDNLMAPGFWISMFFLSIILWIFVS